MRKTITKSRLPDVALIADGKTGDGKPMFKVEQTASIPPVVVGKKGEKRNLSQTEVDHFGVRRQFRISWLQVMYGSASDWLRRK